MHKDEEYIKILKGGMELWNELPGGKITLMDCRKKFCPHREDEREPEIWNNMMLCRKCGYEIKQVIPS